MRPTLREPQGWRYLEDHELTSRLAVLLDAGLSPGQLADGVLLDETWVQSNSSRPLRPNATHKAGAAPLTAEGAIDKAIESPSDTVRQWARLSIGLPVLALAVSLGMAAPLLVWAPLLGGLCLGLAGLQFALVRRWLLQRQALQDQGAVAFASDKPVGLARGTPTGVLLAGFLSVFGLMAAIVLYTTAIRNRDTAAMAQIHATPQQPPDAQGQNPGLSPLLAPKADHETQHRSHP